MGGDPASPLGGYFYLGVWICFAAGEKTFGRLLRAGGTALFAALCVHDRAYKMRRLCTRGFAGHVRRFQFFHAAISADLYELLLAIRRRNGSLCFDGCPRYALGRGEGVPQHHGISFGTWIGYWCAPAALAGSLCADATGGTMCGER